jgi:hypothetical protein
MMAIATSGDLAQMTDRELMVAMWRELSAGLDGVRLELAGVRQGVAQVVSAQAHEARRIDALITDTRALGGKVLRLDTHVRNQMHLARERIRALEAAC